MIATCFRNKRPLLEVIGSSKALLCRGSPNARLQAGGAVR